MFGGVTQFLNYGHRNIQKCPNYGKVNHKLCPKTSRTDAFYHFQVEYSVKVCCNMFFYGKNGRKRLGTSFLFTIFDNIR